VRRDSGEPVFFARAIRRPGAVLALLGSNNVEIWQRVNGRKPNRQAKWKREGTSEIKDKGRHTIFVSGDPSIEILAFWRCISYARK
jgi:hypothetical protein